MSLSKAIAYLKYDDPMAESKDAFQVPDDVFPAHLPLGNGLTCYYLLDTGDSFEYVQTWQVLQNAETIESLHTQAVANLAALAETNLVVKEYGNIFVALMGGNFEASLILVDELWDETYAHVVENDFVAVLPARDILAFCDSESEHGKAELVATVDRIWPGTDHLLTDKVYRRVGRQWRVDDSADGN